MALALLHAGAHQPPPNKVGTPKVPAAAPLKTHAEEGGPKPKFQALLEQLSHPLKPEADLKVKLKLETAEKPKEARKADHKEVKDAKEHREHKEPKLEGLEAAFLAKAEPPKPKPAPEPEGTAKTAVRERKVTDAPVPQAVTAASMEVARSQAQQQAPRAEREDRQKVFVVDKRTEVKEKEKLKLPGAEAAAQQPVNGPEAPQAQTKTDTKGAEVQVTFQSVAGKNHESFDLKPQNTPVSPRDALTFQQYLVEKGYGQLVDQARIVLKDQNAGEIRMTLYPESLGKVKVNLNLSDNSLAGQIFVENQTVKDVFQSNMDGLIQAFRDGGWNNMSLEVSVGNGNQGQAGQQQAPSAPARDYGRQVTQSAETRTESIGAWNDRQINLTA